MAEQAEAKEDPKKGGKGKDAKAKGGKGKADAVPDGTVVQVSQYTI